jgi:N-methylhydantoinase A/oxoprolinase/acetone carboxylase beta subunit
MPGLKIGVETGGTFTDIVAVDGEGRVWGKKGAAMARTKTTL